MIVAHRLNAADQPVVRSKDYQKEDNLEEKKRKEQRIRKIRGHEVTNNDGSNNNYR